jgi:hypothetical protein
MFSKSLLFENNFFCIYNLFIIDLEIIGLHKAHDFSVQATDEKLSSICAYKIHRRRYIAFL